jgi:uncharacterized membrane protein YkvA (DUF1232 family)
METTKRGTFTGASKLLEPGMLVQARLAWRLLRDQRVSSLKFALPVLLFIYVVSPLDAIPDLLPIIGQTDDLGAAVATLMLMIRLLPRLAPGHVVDDHLRTMNRGSEEWEPRAQGAEQVIDARFSVRG